MKIFITCAVMVFIAAVVVSVNMTRNPGGPVVVTRSEPVYGERSLPQEVEQTQESRRAALPASAEVKRGAAAGEVNPFDTLAIYDALLMLNFADDASLLVDRNTLAFLRAVYAALGESAGPEAIVQLRTLLEQALPAAAAQQLWVLMEPYFAYRQAAADVRHAASQQSDDPMYSYHQLVALRRNYLGEDAAGRLFAEEEAQLPYMTSAFAVARDKNLSEEVRAARLAELQEAFNRTASRMNSPLATKVLAARVARLRADGAGEAEVFAVREEVLGSAEAQRLAEEDRNAENRAEEPGSQR